ncbi:DUF2150 family protein [Archaeoglobus sp.]
MEFYTQERFRNWISIIEKVEVKADDPKSFEVFDHFIEDFAIACLKLIDAVKNREITKKKALELLESAKRNFLTSVDFGDELKNEVYEFIRESIKVIAQSTSYYLQGKFSKKSFEQLLKEAIEKERKGDLSSAFETVAKMGAKVLKGEELPEFDVPEGIVANWLDGVETLAVVMKIAKIDQHLSSS